MHTDPASTRTNLIKYLRHLTANVWPEYEHEWVLPEEADRLLRVAHVAALRYIGINLQADPIAREFVETINNSIPGPPYDFHDTLLAARKLAPPFLRRAERERSAEQHRALNAPLLAARQEYVRENAETNPWLEDANVSLDGLLSPKTQVRFNPMDGSVINEF